MRRLRYSILPLAIAAIATPALIGAAQPAARPASSTHQPTTPSPKAVGYAVGAEAARSIADRLEADGIAFDAAALVKGFSDALLAAEPEMTPGEVRRVLIDLEIEVGTRRAEERMRLDPLFAHEAEENAQRGTALQQSFERRAGVTKMPSGLMYEVARPGAGEPVGNAKIITVTYTGATAGGVIYTEGQAARVEVASLLPAIREAAQSMRVGEKRVMVVPPELAFGLAGQESIGPNETLIITAELLEIER